MIKKLPDDKRFVADVVLGVGFVVVAFFVIGFLVASIATVKSIRKEFGRYSLMNTHFVEVEKTTICFPVVTDMQGSGIMIMFDCEENVATDMEITTGDVALGVRTPGERE